MRLSALAWAGLVLTSAAQAAETTTYHYDARGRLVQVVRSGSVNNGVTTSYQLDKADNRTNKTTTGSANPPSP
jgi:YD repeat-containing protein